jgi:hypothetical protein
MFHFSQQHQKNHWRMEEPVFLMKIGKKFFKGTGPTFNSAKIAAT